MTNKKSMINYNLIINIENRIKQTKINFYNSQNIEYIILFERLKKLLSKVRLHSKTNF